MSIIVRGIYPSQRTMTKEQEGLHLIKSSNLLQALDIAVIKITIGVYTCIFLALPGRKAAHGFIRSLQSSSVYSTNHSSYAPWTYCLFSDTSWAALERVGIAAEQSMPPLLVLSDAGSSTSPSQQHSALEASSHLQSTRDQRPHGA